MKDKVNIENLFKEKFDNFSPKPDPSVFQGIQSGLNASGAAGGAASSGLSLAAKVAAIVVSSMTLGGTIGYFISNNNTTTILVSNIVTPKEIVVENTTPLVKESNNESTAIKNPITIKEGKVYESKEVPEKRVQEYLGKQETKQTTNSSTEKSDHHDQSTEFTKIPKKDSKTVADEVHNNSSDNNSIAIPDFKNDDKERNQGKASEPKQVELTVLSNPRKGHAPLEVEFFAQSNAEFFEWNFDDEIYSEAQNPIHIFEAPGKYKVSVTAFIVNEIEGKKVITEKTEYVQIDVQPKSRIIKIPNTFTPSGDGVNDYYHIETEGIHSFSVTFTDLKGNTLYKSDNPNFRWDGYDLYGKPVSGDVNIFINAVGEDGSRFQETRRLTITRKQ